MRHRMAFALAAFLLLASLITACAPKGQPPRSDKKTIIVTYAVLGAAVNELAGDLFEVKTLIPNGLDIHAWEPSAKDIEALAKADLIVQNGLELEHSVEKAIEQARSHGVKVFTASEHITVRTLGEDEVPHEEHGKGEEHAEEHHHEHGAGGGDPHLWTDPLAIKAAMEALAGQIKRDFGQDLSQRSADMGKRLDALDAEIRGNVEALPVPKRKLVTGHESLGYFAQRYGFKLVGAVVPSITTEAESSAADMGALKQLIRQQGVSALFTEAGTPARTVEALGRETKVKVVLLSTHMVPADGSYFSFERNLANEIIKGLQ